MSAFKYRLIAVVLILTQMLLVLAEDELENEQTTPKPKKKKDIRDYSDADLERLYDQWEEGDEPLEPDELPEWDPRRPQPQVDFSKLDMSNPESIMQATKKGKTLMMFAKVTGKPTRDETEEITALWQTGLWNNHVQTERYLLEDDRVIFMFKDGAVAWEAKDFLIEQERCQDVQLEQKTYCGKFAKDCKEDPGPGFRDEKPKKKKKKSKKKEEL